MNKRLTIILVVLVGVGFLFFGFKLIHESKKIKNIESIVSDEAIHYLSAYDLSEKINNFTKAPFYRKIVNLPLYKKYIGSKIGGAEGKNFSILELLDDESALAIFSSQIVFTTKNKPDSGKNIGDFIFFTRLDTKKKFKKLVGDFYLSFGKKESSDYLKYKGIKVKRINFSKENNDKIDLTMHYALLGDVLLVGNSDELIKKSIDLYKGDNDKSLLKSEAFYNVTNEHGEVKNQALVWLYTNQKNFNKKVLADMEKDSQFGKGGNELRKFQINLIEGFLKDVQKISIGSFSFVDYDNSKQGIFYKKYNYYDDSLEARNLFDILRTSGIKEKNPLELVPGDTFSCFGVANNFSKSWKSLKNLVPDFGADLDTNKFLGLDIDREILPLLDQNIVSVFADIKEKPFNSLNDQNKGGFFSNFPIPVLEAAVFIETKDLTAAKEGIDLISQKVIPEMKRDLEAREMRKTALRVKQGLPNLNETEISFEVERENYKGADINILSSNKESLDINYFNWDKYIIVSTSLDMAKKVLDVPDNQYNFLNRYSKNEFMKENLSLPYSYIYIIDVGDIIKKIIQTKIFNMSKMYVPMVTQSQLSAIDINSIVDVLTDISSFMGTQRILQDGIIENIKYIKIKGLI